MLRCAGGRRLKSLVIFEISIAQPTHRNSNLGFGRSVEVIWCELLIAERRIAGKS
jgi:hypothetical protein